LTVKLNTVNLKHILAALERYSYNVQASFSEEGIVDTNNDRYDSLMKYLNV